MNTYLDLVSRIQKAAPRKTWLTILSVALSVALVTAIFSMLDVFRRTELIQVINSTGNYHLMIENPTEEEKAYLRGRIDVYNAGEWIGFETGELNGAPCQLASVDENFAPNMTVELAEGRYPTQPNEVMLERWALDTFDPPLRIGDTVQVTFAGGAEDTYMITGLFNDFGSTKASAKPGVLLSMAAARAADARKESAFLIEFKPGVNVLQARQSIQSTLNIPDERVGQNEKLLAVMGQSEHQSVLSLYATAAVLFFIVLVAGVVMIYNTFNISVMERVRQFGLLRCIGASKRQIRSIVRREGLRIILRAVPLGLLAGILVTFACSALLKFYNSDLFGEMPLFVISLPGVAAGVVIGFLTVLTASFAPANKAASVSPLNAVTGSSEMRASLRPKSSFLTHLLPVEVALGVNNATARKRTLVLMSASIAISIILFLGFNVYVDFMHTAMKTTKPYTPDVSLLSGQGLPADLYARVGAMSGVKRAYGRMFGYVNASFDASLLTQDYLDTVGGVQVLENGRFVPPEKSWLISFDANQLRWIRENLVEGTLDEAALNEGNGIVAVIVNLRNNITTQPALWHIGDTVVIDTPSGPQEKTVMAILRTVPFADSELNLTTLITTEKQYIELTGDSTLDVIDVQLEDADQEQTIREIRAMLSSDISFHDLRQKNAEVDQAFFSIAVFVYGFVAVIALISVLNIVSTIQTSVAAKIRYLGVMRAVGMTGGQLDRMVLAEAGVYSLVGALAGCVLGVLLQRNLAVQMLSFAHIPWTFPWQEIVIIAVLVIIITGLSVLHPLRQIKSTGIAEVVVSL
jgi:putative ABC transport system permease protein